MIISSRPEVSVVVLSYFHKAFIERALRSAINQTCQSMEIIYIDNASSDGTFEAGLAVLERSKIPYKAEQLSSNVGCSAGLNHGLKKYATGDYFSVLSADDWWDEDNISLKLAKARSEPEAGMIYGNGYNFNDQTKALSLYYSSPQASGFLHREILSSMNINPLGILYNHSLVRSHGYFDAEANIEDRELWCRISESSPIAYIHQPVTFYRIHGSNISSNINFMRAGYEHIFSKWEVRFPEEIAEARLQMDRYIAYHLAENSPDLVSLMRILRNYRFDWPYTKQLIKCLIGMGRRGLAAAKHT